MTTSLILRRAAKKPVSRPDTHMPAVTHTHMKCLEKILIQIDVRFTRKFTSVSEYSCSYFDTDR